MQPFAACLQSPSKAHQFQHAILSASIVYLSALIYVLSFEHWLVFLGAHSCLVACTKPLGIRLNLHLSSDHSHTLINFFCQFVVQSFVPVHSSKLYYSIHLLSSYFSAALPCDTIGVIVMFLKNHSDDPPTCCLKQQAVVPNLFP
jgi:hypothetical protein